MSGFFAPYMYMRNRSHIDAREIHYDQIFYSQSFLRWLCNVAQNSLPRDTYKTHTGLWHWQCLLFSILSVAERCPILVKFRYSEKATKIWPIFHL